MQCKAVPSCATTNLSFHPWRLTDFTSPPHTIPLTLRGIHDWRSYAATMGYHEPHKGRIGSGVCSVRMGTSWHIFTHPKRTTLYLLYTNLCTGELNAIRKENAFSAVLSMEGCVVVLGWAKLKPQAPKGSAEKIADKGRARCLLHPDPRPPAVQAHQVRRQGEIEGQPPPGRAAHTTHTPPP